VRGRCCTPLLYTRATRSCSGVNLGYQTLSAATGSESIFRPARVAVRSGTHRERSDDHRTARTALPGRLRLPVLGKVTSTGYTDRVQVRLVSGQSAADFAARTENLAHGFAAMTCRVRSARPGAIVLELARRDALAQIIPALPVRPHPSLKALPVGRREDGSAWLVKLHGTHLLVAGSTGAGKGSVIWGLLSALLPAIRDGVVQVLACDPKLMELAYGRPTDDRPSRADHR
jgi:hypothetical protein